MEVGIVDKFDPGNCYFNVNKLFGIIGQLDDIHQRMSDHT